MIGGIVLYFAAIVAFSIILYPATISSALTMDFKAGFSWPFIRSFLTKVGLSMLGYYLLVLLVSFPLTLMGYLALIVGVYVVAAWIQFAVIHLVFQHYDLFLERGGEALEVNPEVTKDLWRIPQGPPPLPPNPPA